MRIVRDPKPFSCRIGLHRRWHTMTDEFGALSKCLNCGKTVVEQ